MTDGTFTLVDARGRKYLTAKERERFLAAARRAPETGRPDPGAHPRDDGVPGVRGARDPRV